MICPKCGSSSTNALIGDLTNCTNCGAIFTGDGKLASPGPDAETRQVAIDRLNKNYDPNVVGNYADLQRLGGEKAPQESETAFVMPPTGETADNPVIPDAVTDETPEPQPQPQPQSTPAPEPATTSGGNKK